MKLHYDGLSEIPLWLWVVIGIILLAQGTWIFLDARRRGARPWLWGLWGLIQFPTPLVVYYLVVIWWPTRKGTSGK